MEDQNAIWEKAFKVDGYDSNLVRQDCCGAWILKSEYGNRNSMYGWEVDHVYPKSKGGGEEEVNLRPMQWENNRAKGDDYPVYTIVVQANGNENVYLEKQFKVNDELITELEKLYNKG